MCEEYDANKQSKKQKSMSDAKEQHAREIAMKQELNELIKTIKHL